MQISISWLDLRAPALAAALLATMPALSATTAVDNRRLVELQNQVQGLLDREAIRQVMLTYARTIDARDWESHRKLFAENIEVEGRWNRTRDDLMRGKMGFFGAIQATQHLGMVIEIDVKGDDAHVVSLLHAQHYQPNEFGEPIQRMVGTYDYWLHRSPAGWQIYKYLHNTSWNEGNYWIYQNALNAAEKASSAPPK
jgi:SnoaL-like domain